MTTEINPSQFLSRRALLKTVSSGFGFLAFSSLATLAKARDDKSGNSNPLATKDPHFPTKAKRVIFL